MRFLPITASLAGLLIFGSAYLDRDYGVRKPEIEIRIQKLSDYNPPVAKRKIRLDRNLENYLVEGFDLSESWKEIKNPESFKKTVLREAGRLGYPIEKLKGLSVKESVELASRIVESRFSYYTQQDIIGLPAYVSRLTLISTTASSEDHRKEIQDLQEKIGRTHSRYTLINSGSAAMTADLDKKPIDELFQEETYVVCRHYTRTVRAVHDVLKLLNPSLSNTYVSEMKTDPTHILSQASAVSPSGKGLRIDIAFFDPTFADLNGKRDALDEAHFGGEYRKAFEGMADSMIKNLQNYKIEIDLSNLPTDSE